jgi:hypothetical protein
MNNYGTTFIMSSIKVFRRLFQLITLTLLLTRVLIAQQHLEGVSKATLAQIKEASLRAPPTLVQPLSIAAHFQLIDINNINDKEEAFEFVGVLTLKWNDPRLSFDTSQEGVPEMIYQGNYQINEVFPGWSPQVVLINQSGFYETSATSLRIQPDGTATLSSMINAVAEVKLSMRRLPFDQQRLEAIFSVFGFDKNEVALRVDPDHLNHSKNRVSIDQWTLVDKQFTTRELPTANIKSGNSSSSFVVNLDIQRDSFFLIRLVLFPLSFIVLLTWSVFWINRESMGDRINICFVGILTAVAYQIVLGDRLPQISYVTFINGFLNISFLMMSATVVVNIIIGSLDKRGNVACADMIESRSRWILPLIYLGLVLLALGISRLNF